MYYNLIPISKINDFVFCPYSLYFHSVYEDFDKKSYKAKSQLAGKIAHQSIDKQKYSDRKYLLQNFEVYSEKYNLLGKIDIYDKQKKVLTERKKKVKKVYDGYLFQLYAQKLCLEEMGYEVKVMRLYSKDNKIYIIKISKLDQREFFNILQEIRNFHFDKKYSTIKSKCLACIYKELCNKKYDSTSRL